MAERDGWDRGLRVLDSARAGDEDSCGWPSAQPLIVRIDPEPYPADCLPGSIRQAVDEVHAFTKAPIPLVACSALTAASLAVQALSNVRRDERLIGPCSLYFLTIAESGERKSTVDGHFMDAIKAYEREHMQMAEPLLKDHAAALDTWECLHDSIKAKMTKEQKAGRTEEVAKLVDELREQKQNKPVGPRVERLHYTDTTPEALAYSLAHTWPSGGLICPEGGVVFGGHAMARESLMRTLGLLNKLWDGDQHAVDRRTGPSYLLHDVRLTIGIQAQEIVLRAACGDHGALFRGTGFFARLLIAWPESTAGTRLYEPPPKSCPALSAFHRRLRQLLDSTPPLTADGVLDLQSVGMTPAAFEVWVEAYNAIEVELGRFGELADIRDSASKAADNIARMAAVFHIFETAGVHAGGVDLAIAPISESAVRAAVQVVSWHLLEARRFFGEMAQGEDIADALRVDAFLIDWCKDNHTTMLSTRDAQQYGPVRDKTRLADALRYLEELDRVRVGQVGRRKIIRVNPELLEGTP